MFLCYSNRKPMNFKITISVLLLAATSLAQNQSFIEYHNNGAIAFQGTKVDDKLVGDYVGFYEDGSLQSVAKYHAGFLIQRKEYYSSGEFRNTSYFIDGTEFFKIYYYYKNGQLEKEGKIDRQGLKSGEWLYYSEDNELLKIVNYNKDEILN